MKTILTLLVLGSALLGAAQNSPPTLTHLSLTPVVAENGTAVFAGGISNVPSNQPLTLSVNWGDAISNENFSLPMGAIDFHLTHRYLDDGRSGAAMESYPVKITLSAGASPSTNGFLSALFQDLLQRPFDLAQEGWYENQIAQFGRTAVVSAVLAGQEYRGKKAEEFFQSFLHRSATPAEQNIFAASALSERAMVAAILSAPEYFQSSGANDPGTWLDALFYDLLRRPPTAAERSALLPQVTPNGRGAIVDLLLDGSEFRQRTVETWFQAFLHRPGGASAGAYVLALANQTWEQTLAQLLGSSEYYANRSRGTAAAGFVVLVTNVPPVLTFVDMAPSLFEGGIASLSGQFSDPGSLDTFALQIDWGDGSPLQTMALAGGVRAFNVPHLFATPSRTNEVKFTLTDDDGGAVTQARTVIVNERAPRFTAIQRQPGSITRLEGLGVPARTYTVQASTNLVTWFNLGSITATANGSFTAYDMPPPTQAQRSYRLRSP